MQRKEMNLKCTIVEPKEMESTVSQQLGQDIIRQKFRE